MRKVTRISLLILSLILLAFWSPWQSWNFEWINIFGIDSRDSYSGLKVKAFSGELEVFVDGNSAGVTSDQESFLEVYPIEAGEHNIKIVRPGNDGFYSEFERNINFENDVDVVIGYDLGPSLLFSEGHILTAKKSFTKGVEPTLDILSTVDDVDVKLDGRDIGKTPLRSIPIGIDSTHILTFSKKGFDTLEIEILPTEQSERDKLKDVELSLEVNLFAKPVELTAQQ
ncbi:MAG TPA: PEGA domain-containing protein [Candidatus Dojkabacteria bacterium]|nr:PEGA domain-containing protein [Candidatus Dojkabacteria bacterium]HRO65862.1 PEGA domain-containing protein [Candidatus Dojkabacteria bacterium]HRP51405.1 PEGA domain-containing protein [Candidatus Dojkabacteria bacterium]